MNAEISRIWNETPTPLYDKLKNNPYNDREPQIAEKVFHSYVNKLKDAYPDCKIDIDPRGPYGNKRSGNTFQKFEASKGINYYKDFERQEKACQLHKLYWKTGVKVRNNLKHIQTLSDLKDIIHHEELLKEQKLHEERLKEEKHHEAQKQKQKNKKNTRRYKGVKINNLLRLNNNSEPNLISFPKKNYTTNLEGLFGGKKTKKGGSKHKTRKNKKPFFGLF